MRKTYEDSDAGLHTKGLIRGFVLSRTELFQDQTIYASEFKISDSE